MKFSIISDAFQQMEATSKRLELTDILVKLIQEIPEDVIAKAIYLIQGKLRPNFEGVELGIAEKLVMRAMSKSSGIPLKKIEDDYNKGGDLGQTAENILQQKLPLHHRFGALLAENLVSEKTAIIATMTTHPPTNQNERLGASYP